MSRVAVVGGGLAGIAAALRCAEAGAEVALLEVRPRLGGAVSSFERDGLPLDNGQHVFLRCFERYRALLERLGSEGLVTIQERLEIPVLAPGGRRAVLRRGSLPPPLHLSSSLLRYPFLSPAGRLRAAGAARALSRLDPADPALEGETFGAWLGRHGQGPAEVEALWDLIALPALNLPAAEASLAQAAFVFQQGLLADASAGDIGWALAPLQLVHGEPALHALERAGVDVRLRWRVDGIALVGGSLRLIGASGRLEADAVIVAVPHDRVASLLPAGALPEPGAPASLGGSPIVNVHFVYDRPVLGFPMAAGLESPVQYLFDRGPQSGLEPGRHVAVSLSAADRWMRRRPQELRRAFAAALAELLPEAGRAQVEAFAATREHAATFRAVPGSGRLRAGTRTGVPGLFLAGAWTATGWPATMEGAVRSGEAAAQAALEQPGPAGSFAGSRRA